MYIRFLVGKPERKRLLGRTKHRNVDNSKTDLGEIRSGGMDWINLAEDTDQKLAVVRVSVFKISKFMI